MRELHESAATGDAANGFTREEIVDRLESLGLVLPKPKEAVGNYKACAAQGKLLFVSGHGPWVEGSPIVGKVGSTLSAEEGQYAAQHVALGILASIDKYVGFHRIDRLLDSLGLVNAAPFFTEHPAVIDGYSDVMAAVFGTDRGVGARTAIGVSSLPFGIAVEVRCTFALHGD